MAETEMGSIMTPEIFQHVTAARRLLARIFVTPPEVSAGHFESEFWDGREPIDFDCVVFDQGNYLIIRVNGRVRTLADILIPPPPLWRFYGPLTGGVKNLITGEVPQEPKPEIKDCDRFDEALSHLCLVWVKDQIFRGL